MSKDSCATPEARTSRPADRGRVTHLTSRLTRARARKGAREALLSAESLVGEAISEQIRRHHRRRLRRLGWEHALESETTAWARGEPSPRAGNAVDVLIDGAEALPLIANELAAARSHVHISGWFFSPDFALVRGDRLVVLRHL